MAAAEAGDDITALLLSITDELERVFSHASEHLARVECAAADANLLLQPWPVVLPTSSSGTASGQGREVNSRGDADAGTRATVAETAEGMLHTPQAEEHAARLDSALSKARQARERAEGKAKKPRPQTSAAKPGTGSSRDARAHSAAGSKRPSGGSVGVSKQPARATTARPSQRQAQERVQSWLQPSKPAKVKQSSAAQPDEEGESKPFLLESKGHRLRFSRRFREAYQTFMTVRGQILGDPSIQAAAQEYVACIDQGQSAQGRQPGIDELLAGIERLSACLDLSLESTKRISRNKNDLADLCRIHACLETVSRGIEELEPEVERCLAMPPASAEPRPAAGPAALSASSRQHKLLADQALRSTSRGDDPWWLPGAEPATCTRWRWQPPSYSDVRQLHEAGGISHELQLCLVDQRLQALAQELLQLIGPEGGLHLPESEFSKLFRLCCSLNVRENARMPPSMVKFDTGD